jgi:protocatechuate 3,4-dioxygenase beta subunit
MTSDTRWTRRRALRLGLATAGLALAFGGLAGNLASVPAAAQSQDLTPGQSQSLTVAQTEGPYFKAGSPERTSLVDDGTSGTRLLLTGRVLDPGGQPVAGALLDFWQANASGAYDNRGYTLRGHQYTDETGTYHLETVVPGLYPGRTRHIHVKVQAPNGPLLTTQLYFPNEPRNASDGIFSPALVLPIQTADDGTQSASFDFVVPTA